MGNCMFCKKTSGAHDERSDSCKVWLPDGNVMLIFKPTKVKVVMRRYQNYFLVNSESLQSKGRFTALNADTILLMNYVYVMFPMERINTEVTTADIEGQRGGLDILGGGAGGRNVHGVRDAINRGGAGNHHNVGGGAGGRNVGGGAGGRGGFNRGGRNGGRNNVGGGAGGRGANGRGRGRAGHDDDEFGGGEGGGGGGGLYNAAGAVLGAFNAGKDALNGFWAGFYNAGAHRDTLNNNNNNNGRRRYRERLELIPGRPGYAYVNPDHLRYMENIPDHYARLVVRVDSNGKRC